MTALTDPTKGDSGMRTLVTGGSGFIRLGGGGPTGRRRAPGDGGRRPVDGAAGEPGRRALLRPGRAGRDRPGRPRLAGVVAGARPEVVYTWPPRSTCAAASPTRCTTPGSTCSGTIALAKAALEAGCRRLVFASSGGTVYGEPDPAALPIDERHPPAGDEPLRGVEAVGRGLPDQLRRPARAGAGQPAAEVYGPRQDPHGEAGVVAIFCNRLLAGEPVTIFEGTAAGPATTCSWRTWSTPSSPAGSGAGRARWSTSAPGSRPRCWSCTAPCGRSRAGRRAGVRARPAGELARIALDLAEAGRVLGWRPRVGLADGLARTWAWASREVAPW